MKSIYFLCGFLFVSVALVWGCTKDKVELQKFGNLTAADCTDSISFASKVLPMIQQNCSTTGCHSASSAASGYVLTDHSQISSNSGIIYKVMNHDAGVLPMPQGGNKLNDSLIKNMGCWILQGKLNN